MSSEKYTEISRALVQECLDRANKSQDNQIQVKAQIEIELENFPDPPIIVEVNFCKVVPFEIMLNFLTESQEQGASTSEEAQSWPLRTIM